MKGERARKMRVRAIGRICDELRTIYEKSIRLTKYLAKRNLHNRVITTRDAYVQKTAFTSNSGVAL